MIMDCGDLPYIIETRKLFVSERAEVPDVDDGRLQRPMERQSLQFKVGDELVAKVASFEVHSNEMPNEHGSEDLL